MKHSKSCSVFGGDWHVLQYKDERTRGPLDTISNRLVNLHSTCNRVLDLWDVLGKTVFFLVEEGHPCPHHLTRRDRNESTPQSSWQIRVLLVTAIEVLYSSNRNKDHHFKVWIDRPEESRRHLMGYWRLCNKRQN